MRGKDRLFGMMFPPILRETCIICNACARALADTTKETRGIERNDKPTTSMYGVLGILLSRKTKQQRMHQCK